jgi:mono/diheme cytochrome c family protein
MKMYRDDCAGCHGDYGRPSEWGSQDFYPRVPQFALEPPHKPDWQL